MNKKKIWTTIDENSQRVAEANELVLPGDPFRLTNDQSKAVETINKMVADGKKRILLKAPTGAGKTEVFLRVSVTQALEQGGHVVLLIPTRDLARQQHQYFSDRLADTGLAADQMHGGVPPRTRRSIIEDVTKRETQFVVGSAMLLQHRKYRDLLETAALIVVDDVNAFDEDEDLAHLRGLPTPVLFATATPDAVARFLRQEKAFDNMFEMSQMPFDSPPTEIHKIDASWNENIFSQIDMGMEVLKHHIDEGSRIYIISRTRARVPVIGQYVRDRLGVPVSILHGEMADTSEHRRRMRGRSKGPTEDRVTMMKTFRENKPAILVATNLVGSGLDIPMADMVLVTDSDHFGEAEIEQLLGRVGRRERASDAVLIRGTTASPRAGDVRVKANTRVRKGKVIHTYQAIPVGRRRPSRRLV
ncbi:MAG: helicase-related protein [Vulcanimicrobiota bacterium]